MSKGVYEPEQSLTIAERDQLMQDLDRDGFIILPFKLPAWMVEEANVEMEKIWDEARKSDPSISAYNCMNIVERAPIFRRLMMYKPALQLSYDCFGPSFILSQDQFSIRYQDKEGPGVDIGWHSDGPPNFPEVDGRGALHTLRFGYVFSDATADECGAIDVIRGSHRRRVSHARQTLHWQPWSLSEEYKNADVTSNVVPVRGETGMIYAFHNAIWHRAQPNKTDTPRKVAYLQYTPSWMRPHHRDDPSIYDLQGYSDEERWLLCEPRPLSTWMWPTPDQQQRMARFSREAQREAQ